MPARPFITLQETDSLIFNNTDGNTQVGGMVSLIDLDRESTVLLIGQANVITDRAAFLYLLIDGEQVGAPFFTSVVHQWTNVPLMASKVLSAGLHEVKLVVDRYGSSVRIGSRTMLIVPF